MKRLKIRDKTGPQKISPEIEKKFKKNQKPKETLICSHLRAAAAGHHEAAAAPFGLLLSLRPISLLAGDPLSSSFSLFSRPAISIFFSISCSLRRPPLSSNTTFPVTVSLLSALLLRRLLSLSPHLSSPAVGGQLLCADGLPSRGHRSSPPDRSASQPPKAAQYSDRPWKAAHNLISSSSLHRPWWYPTATHLQPTPLHRSVTWKREEQI